MDGRSNFFSLDTAKIDSEPVNLYRPKEEQETYVWSLLYKLTVKNL